ncbi:MAG: hypothetical protein K2K93_03655 [Muribaculaceae bacterium]|nr:hypothetical protein [Muribaculaceae bacterium]
MLKSIYVKYFLCVALLVSGCFLANAQEFHYAALYEAAGPVKQIKYLSKPSYGNRNVKIKKDGRGGLAMMSYDDAGYPVGFQLDMFGKENYQKFYWNTRHQLDSVAYRFSGIGERNSMNCKIEYAKDAMDKVVMTVDDNGCKKIVDLTFSNYVFDDRGNWISRMVDRIVMEGDKDAVKDSYEERREIKYYDVR